MESIRTRLKDLLWVGGIVVMMIGYVCTALTSTQLLPLEQKWASVLFFVLFALLAFAKIWQLSTQLRPKMDIVFGDYPLCCETNKDHTYYRVGVINKGGSTVEDFCPSLESIEPPVTIYPPASLQITHHPGEQKVSLPPSVNNNPSLFADVIAHEWIVNEDRSVTHSFRIAYFQKAIPCEIKPGNYTIQISATGKNVPTVAKRFNIIWECNHMRVENIKDQ